MSNDEILLTGSEASKEIFLARDDEQDRLRGVLAQVLDGRAEPDHGFLVLVHGLGGIGKSTLLKRYRRIVRGELQRDRSFLGKFLLAKVNWEELRRVNPGAYPPGGPPLWRALDDVYRAVTDAATGHSKGSSRQAARAFERFRELAAKARDEHFAVEAGTPGVDIAEAAIGQLANLGSLLPLPYAKQGADAVKEVTTTAADVTRRVRKGRISPDQFEVLVRPDDALWHAFTDGLREVSRMHPLVLSLDTAELLGKNLLPLFDVVKRCGSNVLWMVAMRLEDDDQAREKSVMGLSLNQMPSSRVRLVVPNRFTSRDIDDYLRNPEKLGEPVPPGVTADAVQDVTHGIPLAVQLVVESLKSGMRPAEALSEVRSTGEVSEVVRGLAERYLMHVSGDGTADQNPDLALIYGLALLEGTRDPTVLAALWDIGPEQVSTTKDSLRRRHDFVLASAPWLHQEVRDTIRLYLLDADQRVRVRAANERAATALRNQLKNLGLDTVEAQLASDQWREITVAVLWHTMWTDDRQGLALLAHLLPAATLIRPEFRRQLLRIAAWFTPVFPDELKTLTAGLQALDPSFSLLLRVRDLLDRAAGLRAGAAPWTSQALATLQRGCRYPDGILAADIPGDTFLDLLQAAYPRTFALNGTTRFELLEKADATLPATSNPPGALSQLTAAIARQIAQTRSQDGSPASSPEERLELAQIAARRRPDSPQSWTNLAWQLLENGNPAEALTAAEQAVRISGSYAAGHHARGVALRRLGHENDALSAYDDALSRDPRNFNAHFARGYVLSLMRRPQDAIQAYTVVLDLAPNEADAYANRGEQLLVLGQTTKAIADLREAARLGATVEPQILLALAIWKANATEAAELCREALEHEDQGLTAFRLGELRAWAYLILGEVDTAEAEFRTVTRHRQRDDLFTYQLYDLLAGVPGIERLLDIWRAIDGGIAHDQAR